MPPKELFSFESADFLQIGKSVRMPSKKDVFPFHIIGPHIQPDTMLHCLLGLVYLDDSRVDDEGNEMTWLDHLQEKMPDLQSPSFDDTFAEQSEMQTIIARLNEIMPQAIIIGQLREQGLMQRMPSTRKLVTPLSP